ncbi:MAG: hypothetical protein GX606_05185 [Elusimicrobia bacterium]|nr:hypothetical protein [Elusimicrobiota bacterium]
MRFSRQAQSIMEYSMVIMLVTGALMVMYTFVKRGTQSLVKVGMDQIGLQANSEQNYESQYGYTETQGLESAMNTTIQKTYGWRNVERVDDMRVETTTHTFSNGGFSEVN